jgi:RNA polymerase sigma factor (TIGR02999 family)
MKPAEHHKEERQGPPAEITHWLRAWRGGDAASGDRLIAALYGELREMARQRLRGEHRRITLQTTALVHETYLRLIGNNRMTFQDRHHFLALSATVMRRVLVDRARERLAGKRGGGAPHIELSEVQAAGFDPGVELLDVDRALDRLAAAFPRQARVVELRFFGGLEEEEIAGVLETSVRTTRRDWAFASAWLARELGPPAG